MNRVAVFSPRFDAQNGQAVVTKRVVQHILPEISNVATFVYEPGFSLKSIISWITASLATIYHILASKSDTFYVVCSRTKHGFLRDLPALSAAFFGKRVIVHCHGSDFLDLLTQGKFSYLVRPFYKRCGVIIPCSYLQSRVVKYVGDTYLCENFFGSDADVNTQILGQERYEHPLRVLWNSNIMASKGFFEAVEAVHLLVKTGYSIEFFCFGKVIDDDEKSITETELQLSECRRHAWFKYLGLVDHAVAISALQGCDVVVLPSRYRSEMQPLALIEGMCASKRIIVSDRVSLRVTVGHYPADFVPCNDVDSIAECLQRLCLEKSESCEQFRISMLDAGKAARIRFSVERFDGEIKQILLGIRG